MRTKCLVKSFLSATFTLLMLLPTALFAQADFYKGLTGDEASPLLPEDHEKAIRDIPRHPEIIELYKKIVGAEPLPPR